MSIQTDRWYVRCIDCLSVGAVETNPYGQKWKCGICAGPIEVMGKVVQEMLETEKERSACDRRCTHAIGPVCVCKCGCVNHGTGRVVKMTIRENIPTIEFTDAEKALAAVTSYRDTLSQIEAQIAALGNSWYGPAYLARQKVRKAREARKFDTRMKRLAEAAQTLAPRAVA